MNDTVAKKAFKNSLFLQNHRTSVGGKCVFYHVTA